MLVSHLSHDQTWCFDCGSFARRSQTRKLRPSYIARLSRFLLPVRISHNSRHRHPPKAAWIGGPGLLMKPSVNASSFGSWRAGECVGKRQRSLKRAATSAIAVAAEAKSGQNDAVEWWHLVSAGNKTGEGCLSQGPSYTCQSDNRHHINFASPPCCCEMEQGQLYLLTEPSRFNQPCPCAVASHSLS